MLAPPALGMRQQSSIPISMFEHHSGCPLKFAGLPNHVYISINYDLCNRT